MRLISIREFCAAYRVTKRTVWNWVKNDRLVAVRDSGGRILRLVDPQWPILDDQSGDSNLVMRLAVLKPRDVAALLGVLPATVRKMASEGRLKAVWVGSQRRFSLSEVRRAIAERTLGRRPRNPQEKNLGILRWAARQLGQK